MTRTPRILFYAERDLHLGFLEPLEHYLRTNQLATTAFSAPEYFAGMESVPGWGLTDDVIQELGKKAPFFTQPTKFRPDVTIVADACHFRIPEIKDVINVGHGMICKGAFYTDSHIIRRENLSRMLLVPGPWHMERIKDQVFIPIQVTGFIKSDRLFGPDATSKEAFCRDLGIDPGRRIVLFAPTYNPELSAMHCIGEGVRKIADQDTILLIKLHNLTERKWKDMYRNIARKNPNIFYLEDADYSGMMHAADLMVSDVSSIFIEFLLLDKPVVLFNNPRIKEFHLYRPQDIEYQSRDAGVQVRSLEELLAAIDQELRHPTRLSALRQQYAQALDLGRDGQSTARAATAILNWVHGRASKKRPVLPVFLLEPEDADREAVAADIHAMLETCAEYKLEISVFGAKEKFDLEHACHVHCKKMDTAVLCAHLRHVKAPHACILCGGLRMPRDWPQWLMNHFYWEPDTGAVKALTDPQLAAHCLEQLRNTKHRYTHPEIQSFALLIAGIGQSIPGANLPAQAIVMQREILEKLPLILPVNTLRDIITCLGLFPSRMGKKTLMAVDCNIFPVDEERILLERVRTLRRSGRFEQAAALAAGLRKKTGGG